MAVRAEAKLTAEPIEDLRLDFEDGYGNRGDEVEDADAVAVAGRLADALASGAAPAFVGLRFKCFEEPTRRRGLRTLDLFLSTLLERTGDLPDNLVITFPKVSTVSQVEAMVATCAAYEDATGLPAGRLGFEIQVETPPLILGADGTAPIAAALHAGAGRVTSLHYGTYDYSASLQVSAEYQSMEHPVADYAKDVMQAAVAGTGVHLSDGSTNILPVGSDEQIQAAWRLHHRLVRRSLERAIYQGWDLHPAQLPTRFIANIAFYREGFDRAADPAARLPDQVRWGDPGRAGHRPGSGPLPVPGLRLRRGHRRRAGRSGRSGRRPAGAAGPPEVRHRERGGPAPLVIGPTYLDTSASREPRK